MYQKVLFKTLYLFLRIHFNRTYTRADSTRGQRITGFETRDGHSVRHSGSRECDHPSWQLPGTKLTWLHCRITASASSAKQFLVQNWQYMSKNLSSLWLFHLAPNQHCNTLHLHKWSILLSHLLHIGTKNSFDKHLLATDNISWILREKCFITQFLLLPALVLRNQPHNFFNFFELRLWTFTSYWLKTETSLFPREFVKIFSVLIKLSIALRLNGLVFTLVWI